MAKSNKEVTGARAASSAAKILTSSKSSRLEKRAAGSALTQRPDHSKKSNAEVTHKRAASAAGKVLASSKSSRTAKSAAASALAQSPNKR